MEQHVTCACMWDCTHQWCGCTQHKPEGLPFDVGNQIGPDPEESGYDAGGWLRGGALVIPASTMRPAPQLSPEQVAAYNRLFGLTRAPEES